MLVKIVKIEDQDQTASVWSSLIRVYSIDSGSSCPIFRVILVDPEVEILREIVMDDCHTEMWRTS